MHFNSSTNNNSDSNTTIRSISSTWVLDSTNSKLSISNINSINSINRINRINRTNSTNSTNSTNRINRISRTNSINSRRDQGADAATLSAKAKGQMTGGELVLVRGGVNPVKNMHRLPGGGRTQRTIGQTWEMALVGVQQTTTTG
jgi:hypothetical protein